ncbi:MAG TPA: BrnA antitoxin family protein [Thermoanaerobaculia bacterium]|nr:BrnA antitoxin family protein [Thermoanaerobaculia bacterium]
MSDEEKQSSPPHWARIVARGTRISAMSDVPPLDEGFFREAEVRMPRTRPEERAGSTRVSRDWFKRFEAQGRDFQARINAVLRMYMEGR